MNHLYFAQLSLSCNHWIEIGNTLYKQKSNFTKTYKWWPNPAFGLCENIVLSFYFSLTSYSIRFRNVFAIKQRANQQTIRGKLWITYVTQSIVQKIYLVRRCKPTILHVPLWIYTLHYYMKLHPTKPRKYFLFHR